MTASSADAAPAWLPAGTLAGPFPTPTVSMTHQTAMLPGPQAAMDDSGDLFMAVRAFDGSHFKVQVVQRQADGTAHTQTLGSPTADVDEGSVRVAVAADGEALVAWTQSGGQVFVATGTPGQDLTTRGSLGTAQVFSGANPVMTVAAGVGGDRAVAFLTGSGMPTKIARAGPGETIGSAVTVTGSEANSQLVAITPGGETVVGWTKSTTAPTERTTLEADTSVAARGGAFSAPAAIPGSVGPAPTTDNEARGGALLGLAADGAGTVHALVGLVDENFIGTTGELDISDRPAGGTFPALTTIPGTATAVPFAGFGGQVFSDRAGDVLVDASESAAGGAREFVRRAGGAFVTGDSQIGGDTFSGALTTFMGPSGAAGFLYRTSDGVNEIFRSIGLDGAVGPPTILAAHDNLMAVQGALAFDAAGDGLAVWPDFDQTSDRVRFAALDATPPRLSGLAVPAIAAAGTPVTFSVGAIDQWNVASINWQFGDGTTAAGAQVSHAFTATGRKTVSVTATDAAGNTSAPLTGVVAVGGPSISKLAVSPNRFAPARARKKGHSSVTFGKHIPRGTTIRFTLSEKAKVTLTVLGKKVRHCRKVHGKRRCTTKRPRFVVAKARSFKQGADRLAFSGRVRGKALKRGRYTLRAVATDAARNRGNAVNTQFTVVRG